MKLIDHFQQLKALFTYDRKVNLENSPMEIHPFQFHQQFGDDEICKIQQAMPPVEFCPVSDDHIEENKRFIYTVFVPKGVKQFDHAILLLHGLNEHSWEKYLPWAEHLASKTGKAVILFPIAFHMNRTPESWYNPRAILPFVDSRRKQITGLTNSTFVNVALSSRLSENPIRFYISGRESIFNLWQLVKEIKNGQHPLFNENTSVNIFAYSIGAFLAQVLLLANPEQLVSDSKLFMFCGGTLFSRMNGNSRDIMDQESFGRLQDFFLNDFIKGNKKMREFSPAHKEDFLEKAFKSMLSFAKYRDFRESFFEEAKNRIKAITLKQDTVIPTIGVREAIGAAGVNEIVEEWDFPYEYSHQIPFPMHDRIAPEVVQQSFLNLFNRAAAFLA
jgi:pimeloyl-ACP methyl ester carboxylesterase